MPILVFFLSYTRASFKEARGTQQVILFVAWFYDRCISSEVYLSCIDTRNGEKRRNEMNFLTLILMSTSVMIPMSEKFLIFYSWLHVLLHLKQHSLAILMMLYLICVGCRFVELCWRIYVSWDFNERERLLVLLLLLHDGIDYSVWKIWLIAFYTDVDRWTRDVDNRSKLFLFPLNIFLSLYLS